MRRFIRSNAGAGSSARIFAFSAGSLSFASRSGSGSFAIAEYDGRISNGFNVVDSPSTMPIGRGATWPRITRPAPTLL